jgi:hypothetical protein
LNVTPLQVTFDYEHEHRFTEHEHGTEKPIQIDTSHKKTQSTSLINQATPLVTQHPLLTLYR